MKFFVALMVFIVSVSGSLAYADNRSTMSVNDALRLTASERGVLFVFGSSCPYCHRIAPVIKRLEQIYGFKVIPVSLDGDGIPGYEHPEKNIALGHHLNVTQVPALFLVDPILNSVAPIGIGLTSWPELQTNLLNASYAMSITVNRQ